MENFALPMAVKLFDQPQPAPLSAPVILSRSEERRVLATETHQPPRQLQEHKSLLQGAYQTSLLMLKLILIATLHGGVKIDLRRE